MQVTVTRPDAEHALLDITAGPAEIAINMNYLFGKCAAENGLELAANSDPEFSLRSQLGNEYVDNYLTSQLPALLAGQAIGQERLEIILDPLVLEQPDSVSRLQDYRCQARVLLKPQFALSDYGPVTITVPETSVSDRDIDDQLLMLAESYALPDNTTEPSAADQPSAVVGTAASTGQSDTADRASASAAADKVAGKIIPAITDSWVAEHIPNASTVPELRELLRQSLERYQQQELQEYLSYSAADQLAQRLVGEISAEIITATKNDLLENLEHGLNREQRSLADFIAEQGGEAAFAEQVNAQVLAVLRQGFALDAYARERKLTVSDEDLTATFRRMAPGQEVEARQDFEQTGKLYIMEEAARRIKANEQLLATAHRLYLDNAGQVIDSSDPAERG
ncbi:MAG: hypothetical protein FWC59_03665 [Actinomycetia bacterium]|nr:hypothetical protein [Actinomycetes bacterium]